MPAEIALLLILAVLAAGLWWFARQPVEFRATRTQMIAAPVERVFAALAAVGEQARWRSDLAGVRVDRSGLTWVETGRRGGDVGFRLLGHSQPLHVVSTFASLKGFVGRRECWLVAVGGQTQVTVMQTLYVDRLKARIDHQIIDSPRARVALFVEDLRAAVEAVAEASAD